MYDSKEPSTYSEYPSEVGEQHRDVKLVCIIVEYYLKEFKER